MQNSCAAGFLPAVHSHRPRSCTCSIVCLGQSSFPCIPSRCPPWVTAFDVYAVLTVLRSDVVSREDEILSLAMQAQLVSLRNALKVTRSQSIAVRGEVAARSLHLSKAAPCGSAFESFQAALSDVDRSRPSDPIGHDESSWWSGNAHFATESSTGTGYEDSSSSAEAYGGSDSASEIASGSSRGAPLARLEKPTSGTRSDSDGVQGASYEAAAGSAVGSPGARGLDASEGVLVTIDVSTDGYLETELLAAVCLGRISKVTDFDIPDGPNVQRNRRIYSQDDLLACLAACAPDQSVSLNLVILVRTPQSS